MYTLDPGLSAPCEMLVRTFVKRDTLIFQMMTHGSEYTQRNRTDRPIRSLTAIDLFCGSGAVTSGLKEAGFRVLAAVDVDDVACQTYRMNHPEVKLLHGDIADLDPAVLKKCVMGELDLLAICAPCQPFSTQNRKRFGSDERAQLLLMTIPIIETLLPRAIFVENVPGLGKTEVLPNFKSALQRLGYTPNDPVVINAVDLGVPQRRKRTIMFACRDGSVAPVDFAKLSRGKSTSVRDWISDLPPPPIGRPPSCVDPLHIARKHAPITLERLKHVPKNGGRRSDIPEALQLKCHRGLDRGEFPDTYGRLAWDEPAPTITTGCTDLTRGRFAHPEEDRAITAREAACLQTFNRDYRFAGNLQQIATQIGNAVPPLMMKALADPIATALGAAREPMHTE